MRTSPRLAHLNDEALAPIDLPRRSLSYPAILSTSTSTSTTERVHVTPSLLLSFALRTSGCSVMSNEQRDVGTVVANVPSRDTQERPTLRCI